MFVFLCKEETIYLRFFRYTKYVLGKRKTRKVSFQAEKGYCISLLTQVFTMFNVCCHTIDICSVNKKIRFFKNKFFQNIINGSSNDDIFLSNRY
jgi:hypothetical protein